MPKNDDIVLRLKKGWEVKFEDPIVQAMYEESYTAPFTVVSSRFKDPTGKGLTEKFWEEYAIIEDCNGLFIPKEICIYDLEIVKK